MRLKVECHQCHMPRRLIVTSEVSQPSAGMEDQQCFPLGLGLPAKSVNATKVVCGGTLLRDAVLTPSYYRVPPLYGNDFMSILPCLTPI